MATMTELVKAIVNENSYLKGVMTNSNTRLGEASLKEIGAPIVADPLARNTFLNNLYNKFITSKVISRMYENPLAVLKGQKYAPYGDTIERMINNPAKAIEYSNKDDNILTNVPPDVKVEYIKVNRQDKYRVSVPYPVLQQAFMSENGFSEFVSACINSLYNGDNIDEFLLMKKIISDMVNSGYMLTQKIEAANDDATVQIKNLYDYMQFPSANFNMYSSLYPTTPLTTWCPAGELVIISTVDYLNKLNVKFLASVFNLSLAELEGRIIKVDGFESDNGINAVVLDEGFMQVHDTVYEMDSFHRADDLSEKTYLHHWQSMQGSLLANAVALCDTEVPSQSPIVSTSVGKMSTKSAKKVAEVN